MFLIDLSWTWSSFAIENKRFNTICNNLPYFPHISCLMFHFGIAIMTTGEGTLGSCRATRGRRGSGSLAGGATCSAGDVAGAYVNLEEWLDFSLLITASSEFIRHRFHLCALQRLKCCLPVFVVYYCFHSEDPSHPNPWSPVWHLMFPSFWQILHSGSWMKKFPAAWQSSWNEMEHSLKMFVTFKSRSQQAWTCIPINVANVASWFWFFLKMLKAD